MKKNILIFTLLSFLFTSSILVKADELPSFKVDINRSGRSEAEGNNPNFRAWTFANANSVSIKMANPNSLLDTVTVTLNGKTLEGADTIVWTNYYKGGITSTTVTADAKLTLDGGFSRVIEMVIHGLPAGKNTLLTYHNNVDGATAFVYNPIKVYVNNTLAVASLTPTVRELDMAKVPICYLTFDVAEGQDAVIS